jgi:hypothetical protein
MVTPTCLTVESVHGFKEVIVVGPTGISPSTDKQHQCGLQQKVETSKSEPAQPSWQTDETPPQSR